MFTMKPSFFLRGMLRRGIFKLEMHGSRPLTSSAALAATGTPLGFGPQQPYGYNAIERKLASGVPNEGENLKAVYQVFFSRIAKDVVVTSVPQSVLGDEIQCAWIAEASLKEKVLNTLQGFPTRIPTPRRLDLYEVRPTPDMGLGLFAKRDMKRGELVLAERPLLVAPSGLEALSKSAIPNHYTEPQILELRITKFKSLLEAAIASLSPEAQDDFKALYNARPSDHLFGITFTNAYAVDFFNGSFTGNAVCKVTSRINHSCMPNVQLDFRPSSFSMQLYATRDMKIGDQLFVSYGPANLGFEERRNKHAAYGFVCKCSTCINANPQADQLRESFEIEIDRLGDVVVHGPSEINQNMLEKALKLEQDMAKEGLDSQSKFQSLLLWICLAYARLGKWEESNMYQVRAWEFSYREI